MAAQWTQAPKRLWFCEQGGISEPQSMGPQRAGRPATEQQQTKYKLGRLNRADIY